MHFLVTVKKVKEGVGSFAENTDPKACFPLGTRGAAPADAAPHQRVPHHRGDQQQQPADPEVCPLSGKRLLVDSDILGSRTRGVLKADGGSLGSHGLEAGPGRVLLGSRKKEGNEPLRRTPRSSRDGDGRTEGGTSSSSRGGEGAAEGLPRPPRASPRGGEGGAGAGGGGEEAAAGGGAGGRRRGFRQGVYSIRSLLDANQTVEYTASNLSKEPSAASCDGGSDVFLTVNLRNKNGFHELVLGEGLSSAAVGVLGRAVSVGVGVGAGGAAAAPAGYVSTFSPPNTTVPR